MALSTGSKVFLVFLLVVFGGAGGALYYFNQQLASEGSDVPPGQPVQITIEQGSTARDIAELLEAEGVIGDATTFRAAARQSDQTLKAGEYEMETGMSVNEALAILVEGPPERETIRFTVREGLAVPLVLEELARQFPDYSLDDFQQVLDARVEAGADGPDVLDVPDWAPDLSGFPEAVEHPFEGLLFPETYEVFADATPQAILQRMLDQTEAVMEDMPTEGIQPLMDNVEQDYTPRYVGLIVASLIERETRVNDERPTVSSVIYNRLDDDYPLQIDATVLYALGEWREQVLTEDTEIDSPYNTYPNPGDPNPGLPPTPIANAGRASIEAAFQPADTDFRFYVLSPECDGTHRFAETLDEHNRNVAAFRDAGRCLEEETEG